ncbi:MULTISPECIES: hypothetical protein [unclassified Pseudoalteromonas]|uniref:hypothetical protein n=1 Tax=unclassified Pseudoalteromonas TaxID=194690 RepID=UPI001B3A153F|nr:MULTISPECIES: hypothetical protein [unclassified Pseudoalteromonas]MBQ4845257.1 hypothetical protein [Pseudoalteromonas sp. MMG005]MBQ4852799.1 hypothetical protein [Pseudoalteromonas sp. MMG012]
MKLKLTKTHLKCLYQEGKGLGHAQTPKIAGGGPNSAFCDTMRQCDDTRLCTGAWKCWDYTSGC